MALSTFVSDSSLYILCFVLFCCLVGTTVKGLDCLFDWVDDSKIDLDLDSPYGVNMDDEDGWSSPNSSLIDDDVLVDF